MSVFCLHIADLEKKYIETESLIYASKAVARCQKCPYEITPEFNTWVDLCELLNSKDSIFRCEKHIDLQDTEKIYLNLTDLCFWCRICEKRFKLNSHLGDIICKLLCHKTIKGIRGLVNLKNTCFINSAIQCLSNCTALKYYLINEIKQNESLYSEHKLLMAFNSLLKDLWTTGNTINPREFIESIYEHTALFLPGEQNDSHEFLMYFLDYLNSTLTAINKRASVIEEIFSGEIENTLGCLNCGARTVSTEKFFDLSIPLTFNEFDNANESLMSINSKLIKKIKALFTGNKKVSLDRCLKSYFEEVKIEDMKDLRHCENCDQKTSYSRKSEIKVAPKVLVVVLKHYGGMFERVKTTFSKELNIRDFYSEAQDLSYTLQALIAHSGLNNLGHYKCYCRNHLDKKWYCFNDREIKEIDDSKLSKISAYIGIYEQTDVKFSFSTNV